VLNSSEDAHTKSMSTFEIDGHLRANAGPTQLKMGYGYVTLYVSGFHPRVCPNAE